MLINAEAFALAVVSSSKPDLSVPDKVNLYKQAYQAAVENNKEEKAKNTKTPEEQIKRAKELRNTLG